MVQEEEILTGRDPEHPLEEVMNRSDEGQTGTREDSKTTEAFETTEALLDDRPEDRHLHMAVDRP